MAKKAGFLKQAGQLAGNLGKAYIDYNLSALGANDVISDSAYKGATGQAFGKATGIVGNITKAAAPAALNLVAPGAGTALKATQSGVAAGGLNKPLGAFEEKKVVTENKTAQPAFMGTANLGESTYAKYKRGGKPKTMVVNIEKDELEVDPETGEIVSDYKSKPKHPENKDLVNMKGFVKVSETSIIIPAKHRDKYLKGDKNTRLSLIKDVLAAQQNRESTIKMEGGGSAEDLPEGETEQAPEDTERPAKGTAGYDRYMSRQAVSTGAAALPALGFAINQTREAKKALGDLSKKPLPQYGITPEQTAAYNRAGSAYSRALGSANRGFSGAETGAFNQRLASSNRTAFENSKKMAGGNLASATNAAINSQNINALLDFASRDAALQRQNMQYADSLGSRLDQVGQGISQQRNLGTQVDIQRRAQQEQALGQALSQGRTNTVNATSQLAGSGGLILSGLL
jgi:hypothetical protein